MGLPYRVMPGEMSVWDQITRVVSLFSSQEVKTPLSFVFRVSLYVAAFAGLALFAPISLPFKEGIVICAGSLVFVLVVFVAVFAWFRPTNLVYGEAGHRAERRLEFGTNRRIRTANQIEAEQGIENPAQLPSPKDEI